MAGIKTSLERFLSAFPDAEIIESATKVTSDCPYTKKDPKKGYLRHLTRKTVIRYVIFNLKGIPQTAKCIEIYDGDPYDILSDNVIPTFGSWELTKLDSFPKFKQLLYDPEIAEHYKKLDDADKALCLSIQN